MMNSSARSVYYLYSGSCLYITLFPDHIISSHSTLIPAIVARVTSGTGNIALPVALPNNCCSPKRKLRSAATEGHS